MALPTFKQPPQPLPTETISSKWYQDINTLPLELFIRVMCDNELQALVIKGDVPHGILQTSWDAILESYTNALGDSEYSLYIVLFKEVSVLAIDMGLVEQSVELLKVVYNKKIADSLIKLVEAPFELNPEYVDEYLSRLDNCLTRAKIFSIRHQLKSEQFAGMQKRYEGNGEGSPKREYFQSVLITLSDHAKYHITEQITVFQYCERIKRLNSYLNKLKD